MRYYLRNHSGEEGQTIAFYITYESDKANLEKFLRLIKEHHARLFSLEKSRNIIFK